MRTLIALILAGYGAAAAVAAEPATSSGSSDDVAPEAVGAVAACAVCHGATGAGNRALDAPRIGGLRASYITRQLEHFRTGTRGGSDDDPFGSQMHAITLMLEDFETSSKDLGEYFSALEPSAAPATVTGNAARGEELYPVCAACHGTDGRGIADLNAPSLVGQADWYIVRQLENYRDGHRGATPEDTLGSQMVPIVKSLPGGDDAFDDIAAYINTL